MSVPTAAPAAPQDPVEDGEDLIVTLPADAPLEDEVSQQIAEVKPPATPVAPVEGLEELQRQVASDKEERDRLSEQNRRLERERAQFAQVAQDFQRRGMSAEEALIETQLTVAQSATDAAKRDYKSAFESGDPDKMAEAQERIAISAADKRALERDKASFLAQRNAVPAPQPVETDPIERALAAYTPATQTWLRSHRDLFRPDGSLKRTAIDAHEAAMDDGLAADTPAYFARVEQALAPKAHVAAEPAPRRNAPTSVAAPVVRTALPSTTRPGPNGEFRLTPKMRELAQASGAPESISYADWAKEYLRMVKTGEMQPIEG